MPTDGFASMFAFFEAQIRLLVSAGLVTEERLTELRSLGNVLVAVPRRYGYDDDDAAPRPDLLRRLCIALFHRWRPGRIFVILTSYHDEAGTHGGSPVTVMAGVMAT